MPAAERRQPEAGGALLRIGRDPIAGGVYLASGSVTAWARLGGAGALLAGAVFLSSILYMFGYLAHLGLTVEMLDRPAELLPWIADHTRAYLGLWWIHLASLLLLLPAPLALLIVSPARVRTVGSVGAAAGLLGIAVGVVSVAVIMATAPILADAARSGIAPGSVPALLSELAGAVGLHLRLFADLLLGAWMGLTAAALLCMEDWRALAAAQIAVAGLALAAAVGKALGWFDLEAVLGLAFAFVYLWIGARLLTLPGLGAVQPVTNPISARLADEANREAAHAERCEPCSSF